MESERRGTGSSDFGTLLRHHRLVAGLSQEALAERAGLSIEGVSALERGFRRTPQRGTLSLLADALELDGERRREFEDAAARYVLLGKSPATVAVGPWLNAETATLPLTLASFVGRKTELVEIARLSRDNRLVTLIGAGGIGKTQTALKVARMQSAPEVAACFVPLAAVADASLLVTAVASALRVQEVADRPLIETVVAYLKNKPALLILDNCEHIITEAAHVTEALLAGCSRVRILATSREPLRVPGEHRYRLPSLNAKDAMSLFRDRAQAVDHRFALTHENTPIVAELCQRLDGIPLAIELAAVRVNALTATTLDKMLDDRFSILSGGSRTALLRQQTMRATIDWSYDALSPQEKRVFERLAVFAGGCTLATAVNVCSGEGVAENDVPELLLSLVDKSMVTADAGARELRYDQLETFREYARDKLNARGAAVVAHRHALAFFEIAEMLAAAHEFEHRLSWEPRLREERENWVAALHWTLIKRGDVLLGQHLIGTLVNSYVFQFADAQRWLDVAVERVVQETPRSVVAALTLAQATVAQNTLNYKVELASSEKAIAEFRALGDVFGVTKAQCQKGRALWFLGHRAEAQALLAETLKFARESGVRAGYSIAALLRYLALASEDDAEAFRGYLGEALSILDALGEQTNTACALADLASLEFLVGNVELSLKHTSDGLAIASRAESNFARCYLLSDIAVYLIALDRWDEASKHARESLRLARENTWSAMAAWNVLHLASTAVLRKRHDPRRTEEHYARSARLLGFVDARLTMLGAVLEPIHRQEHARVVAALHEVLGTEAVAKLRASGTPMTEEIAIKEALRL